MSQATVTQELAHIDTKLAIMRNIMSTYEGSIDPLYSSIPSAVQKDMDVLISRRATLI